MMRLALVLSIVAALAASATALAAGSLPGKYLARIDKPARLNGAWVLNFKKSHAYTIADNGIVVVRGKYTNTGSTITFGHESGVAACGSSAKYSWKRSGTKLTFKSSADKCAGRSAILSHTFSVLK
jgi:hypothetical protein